jgi:sarcosine oxidase gamma subunit
MLEPHPIHAATIRHLPGDLSAASALQDLGWKMPTAARRLTRQILDAPGAREVLLVWRNPQEVLALCAHDGAGNPFEALLDSLAAGRSPTAIAADSSHGLVVLALDGPGLEDWLARLVDAASIPPAGSASGARLGDLPVLLVRPQASKVWLVAERPGLAYINDWLTYAHEGARVKTA